MKKETKTVRVRDLLFALLYSWRKLLRTVVVLALLLGGVMAVKGVMGLQPEALEEARHQHIVALNQYITSRNSLESSIHDLETKLEDWQEYMDASVLMNMDYHNVYEATATLYVDTGYQINPQVSLQNPDYTPAVMVQYTTALTGSAFYQTVAQELQLESKYLRELVAVRQLGDSTLYIQVLGDTEDAASAAMEQILSYARSLTADISKTVGKHTLRYTQDPVAVTVNTDVEAQQLRERQELTRDIDQLVQHQQALEMLEEPQSPVTTPGGVVKDGIKGAIIGGVLGGVLAVLWLAVAFLLSDKVYSGEALEARLGIRVLGSLDSGKKRNALDRWLRKLEGRRLETADFLGARAANCCSGAVALCGNPQNMDSAAQILSAHGVTVAATGDVLCDGTVVAVLPGCAGVVLLAKCGETTYQELSRMAAVAQEAGKPVLAAIALD